MENLHLQIYKVLNDSVGVCPKQLQLLLILGNYMALGMEVLRFVGETLPIELLPELWEENGSREDASTNVLKPGKVAVIGKISNGKSISV